MVPLNNLKLNELRRIVKYALFGELSQKIIKLKDLMKEAWICDSSSFC